MLGPCYFSPWTERETDFVDRLIRAGVTNRYNLDGQNGVLWQRAKRKYVKFEREKLTFEYKFIFLSIRSRTFDTRTCHLWSFAVF
jgi:hypothetical protein